MSDGLTLVLGGTGKTGRRVADRLARRSHPVRIGSRGGQPPFDWLREATWPDALRGVESVYVTYQPDLAVPGASGAIGEFTRLARARGIRRLVLLSGRGEPEAQRCEDVIRESGLAWTILRCSWFAQNFSEAFLLDGLLAGHLELPAGEHIGEPFVDADDIADTAVAALTDDRHIGQVYELTGPRLWTFPSAVAEVARAAGREIRYSHVSADAYATELAHEGVPPDVISLLTYLIPQVLDGRNASLADGVQRALDREPRDFADYVRETAATGVWNTRT